MGVDPHEVGRYGGTAYWGCPVAVVGLVLIHCCRMGSVDCWPLAKLFTEHRGVTARWTDAEWLTPRCRSSYLGTHATRPLSGDSAAGSALVNEEGESGLPLAALLALPNALRTARPPGRHQ